MSTVETQRQKGEQLDGRNAAGCKGQLCQVSDVQQDGRRSDDRAEAGDRPGHQKERERA